MIDPRAVRPASRVTRTTRLRLAAASFALVAVTTMAACGQKGGNDSAPTNNETQGSISQTDKTERATATTRAPLSSATTSPRSTEPSTTTSSSAVSPSTSSSTPRSTTTRVPISVDPNAQYGEFCRAFAAAVNDPSFTNPNINDLQAALASMQKTFQQLADLAPPPIAADWQLINSMVQSLTPQNFQQLGADAESKAASDRITEWTKTNCGFNPDSSGASN
ncbi:MAG: hypothetical protein HYX32_05610 [Actinobacteria bacterium]|nr:hypothetical protein [Actinomycetota bacterium]